MSVEKVILGLCLGLCLGVVLFFAYWLVPGKSYTWHQKLTVEVEQNGKTYTGSSVVEVTMSHTSNFGRVLGYGSTGHYRGEATMVKLPNDKYLFALLKGPKYSMLFIANEIFDLGVPCDDKACSRRFRNFRGTKDLPNEHYPLLVTFKDINDPKSVKQVDPDDMDAVFGCEKPSSEPRPWREKGQTWRAYQIDLYKAKEKELRARTDLDGDQKHKLYWSYRRKWKKPGTRDRAQDCTKLKMTLEITDEPVTKGKVEKILGWFYDVNRIVPKEELENYRRKYSRSIPGKGDFISYRNWRKK